MINMDNQSMGINVRTNVGAVLQQQQQQTVQPTGQTGAAKKKRKRCGECQGCFRKDNCQECGPCKSTRSHQICKMRKCEKLKTKKEKQREQGINNPVHNARISVQIPTHFQAGHHVQHPHLSHLSSRLNHNSARQSNPQTGSQLHPQYSYSNHSSPYPQSQPNNSTVNNNIVLNSQPTNNLNGPQSHLPPTAQPGPNSNPLLHLQHTANNAYPSSINAQNCNNGLNSQNQSIPTNQLQHPSVNNQISPSNQLMHSSLQPTVQLPQQLPQTHMQNPDADQLTRQQMTTNSRLKSFIQNRQHNGMTGKTPVYSPTQSPIGYNNNNFNQPILNGNSLSPHYITAPSPGHPSQPQFANAPNGWENQPANPNELLKTNQHSIVANAAAGHFSRHTTNALNNGQVNVASQRLSGLNNNNSLADGSNQAHYQNTQPPTYANPSLYYNSGGNLTPNSQQPYSPLSKSPSSSNLNRSRSKSSAIQQQLLNTHPMPPQNNQPQPYLASNQSPLASSTSPSLNLNVSHNSKAMVALSHRSKSVDLLNCNDNSNGSSSHSTSSLGQVKAKNNPNSPLNSILNNSNNSNLNNLPNKTTPSSLGMQSYAPASNIQTTNQMPNYYDNVSTPINSTTNDHDRQTTTLSNLLMDIGSSSPSTTSSLAVTSLATYASLTLDEYDTISTTSSNTSTITTAPISNSNLAQNSTAIVNSSTNSSNNTTATNNQLPPVSTFNLPQFRDSNVNQYDWWESNKTASSVNTFNYASNNLQPMDEDLHNLQNNNTPYLSSFHQQGLISNNYDSYQYNGYHTEPNGQEYTSGFTSLTSTLSN